MNRSLLSGRSQQRLMELHRGVSAATQALGQHHSLLVGALLSCDAATQQSMLDEHRSRIVATLDSLARLGNFLDQCRVGTANGTSSSATASNAGDAFTP